MVYALRLTIYGRVQGVGFRVFVAKQAKKRALTGWVKNVSDGSVEVYAEGDVSQLEGLKHVCTSGPLFAQVKQVREMVEAISDHQYTTFTVI